MNIYNNIYYGPFVKGYRISNVESLIKEMLNMLKLHERAKDYPEELSGGARQKVAIARALASGSQLLLLDEPLGSLDAKVRKVMRYELRRLVKDLGLTAIHVTHDQEEAMFIADKIVVMKNGEIVEVGAPLDLYLRPKNLFTAYFVGEVNFLDGEVIDEENDYTKIDVNGGIFYSAHKVDTISKRVVAAIRPEFVQMSRGSSYKGALKGTIEDKSFLGSLIQFKVLTENNLTISVKTLVTQKTIKFNIGERVNIILPPKFLLLYPYPEEGLERAISIE